MSNIDFQNLESYLFAENKQDFLNKLIPNTEAYLFFSLLHAINTSARISPEIEAQIKEYNDGFRSQNSQNVHIRALLKKFDDPSTTQADKEKIIEELQKYYLQFYFDHSKPADIVTSSLNAEQNKLPSSLNPKDALLESELQNVYNSVQDFGYLKEEAYTKLDSKKLMNSDVRIFESFVFRALPTDFEDFPTLIVELMKKKKTQPNSVYPLFEKLSLEQLQELGKLNTDFVKDTEYIQALCRKEFNVASLNLLGRGLGTQEKRDLMLKFYTWVKKEQIPFRNLTNSALYEILQLDLELNKYDKDLFIEFLKNPKHFYGNMTEQQRKYLDSNRDYSSFSFGSDKIDRNELIKLYLEEFFKTAKDTKPFNEYLDSRYLNEIFYSTKLMLGETLETKDVLSSDQLKQLAESKELTICRYNQEYYKANDKVTISLTIKNIPSLMIKIFEFRPENYYLKEQKQLDGSINLDGLIAAEESNIDFKEPPVRRFVKEFQFESISKKKQGIFIIDFIGNGLSSRAVIRKGRLSNLENQTVAGQLFTIVDDEANICKGERTGIWIKGRFYRADDKGRVLVPYSSNDSVKAVLVHDDYAELVDLSLKAESFEFKCAYLYNYESFLMGNKAKVLVQPRLFLNSQPLGLDIIQDCSATVTTINDDNIPSKVSFDKLKLSAYQEVELEFPVPAKLKAITIEVTAKIVPAHKKEPKEYTSNHNININLNSGDLFCSLYLKYSNDGYQVLVLGKNGEPKAGITLGFSFQNRYWTKIIYKSLQTDKEGKVYLGKLEEVTQIDANLQPTGDIGRVDKTWFINNQKTVNYPKKVRINEQDEIVLPLLHNELNRHKISFVQIASNQSFIRNCLKLLKVDKGRLIISGLKEGTYALILKDVNAVISLEVLKGSYWTPNKNFLVSKDSLIDIKRDINNIVIQDIKVKPKENSDVADITIETYVDQPKLARFHIFAGQFLESDPNRLVKNMDTILPSEPEGGALLKLRESQYLNNRKLGDEYCYVLDRKSKTRYLGNTLEKPPVLLKKTFVRETQTKEEQLTGTEEFRGAPLREEERAEIQFARKEMSMASYSRAAGDKAYFARSAAPRANLSTDSFMNFLANPCLVSSNLKPDENGTITIKDFPVKKFSLLQIVASNLSANVSKLFPLESNQVQTKDLTQKARSNDSAYSINRLTSSVPKGKSTQVKDLTSTEIQVVDSISRLFDIQKNFSLYHRSTDNESYETWEFLKDWASLSQEEKLKKYDKFASHELNLFVYFKDRGFFTQVILPFLHNKIERTLIDFFLLKDEKVLLEHAQPEKFKDLNSLEQILVILSLQKSDAKEAQRLAASLESMNSLNKLNTNAFNMYFDTVITSKKVDEPRIYEQRNERLKRAAVPENMMMYACAAAPDYSREVMKKAGVMRLEEERLEECEMECARMDDDYDDFGGSEFLEKRAQIQAGFQELEKTKEYTERHYYGRVDKTLSIPLNNFWVDVAKHIVQNGFTQPLLTPNFIYAHSNNTEKIAVISLLSLPFKAGDHTHSSFEGRGLEIQAVSDLIVFTKAVTEAESDLTGEILIMQRFFDPKDKYTESEEEPGIQIEKEVDQYVIDKVYGCTVIVTNSSASSREFQVLVEIPEGSIPVNSLDYTKSHNLHLNAFSTHTIEYFFYFPYVGKFKVNPPNVSRKSKVVAVGKKLELEVKAEKTYTKLETLTAVLTKGSKEDVLEFARTKNLWNHRVFDFNAIYWLLLDKEFFLKFIQVLRERKYFDQQSWTFGFYHKDIQTIKEYFASVPYNTLSENLRYLDSSLLRVDKLRLLEYNPFINQRVHLLAGEKNKILNVQLKEQYQEFVTYLCECNKLSTSHYLGLVYYLLLQDRVEEAIRFFGKINREELRKDKKHELQYDYFAAYLDFYMGYPKFTVAREICQKYLNYPVLSWRSLFIEVANQLAEFDGGEILEDEAALNEEKKQNQANAAKEEIVNMEVHDSKLLITHQNVSEFTLAFYRVDLEVLFSRNPFITQSKDEFSYIQPSEVRKVKTENFRNLEKLSYEIPEKLKGYNLYVELKTEDRTLSVNYFSTSLKVQIIENYGQVKVLDEESKPLIKVYVKCFAKAKDGKVSFYKDGYTDLRGRFDYATLNSNDISNIDKFAIFIMSDEFGSLIKEAKAPNKLGRLETKLLVKAK